MYLQVEDLVNFHHFVAKLFSLEDVSRHVCNKIEKDCVKKIVFFALSI